MGYPDVKTLEIKLREEQDICHRCGLNFKGSQENRRQI
tara:strand:- start:185 stop:298 length:114 start_codon:yes stop_codon:yes gene_type:complete